ncbi:MAG: hypothetical protein FWF75_09895 [Propionibacteriaceae bacterium]|nr:hypothetical protein [Propionibacteriaceae bacterium]MCL1842031.1 hypothetical protein [Propionibacteriaceae bacterium]
MDVRGFRRALRPPVALAAAVTLTVLLTACTSDDQGATPDTTPVAVSGTALLDWSQATITFPIDRYGMTLHEGQLAEAAGSIEYARCVSTAADAETAAVTEAARYLKTAPAANHWLYGSWDATYIAKYGHHGIDDMPLRWAKADPDVAQKCQTQVQDAGLMPLLSTNGSDPGSQILMAGMGDAYERTTSDPTFKRLLGQWRDCVAKAGYVIETGFNTSAAKIDPSWTEEQVTKAFLTEATCADDMSYTQQVANITAGYQMAYIGQHEAELSHTRQVATQRLAAATKILQGVGLQ